MKMIIGGEYRSASDQSTVNVVNPATGEVFDTVPAATYEDTQEALENAKKGFLEWSQTPTHERLSILYHFADMLEENAEELAQIACREGGKAITLCRSEIAAALVVFRGFFEKARSLYGETFVRDTEERIINDFAFTVREPLGVVACVIPFNYPTELFAHKVAPALAVGNAVIIKPASDTPLANIFVTDLLIKAGVPGNACQIITGSGAKIGKWLAESEKINAISLTGSTEVGIETMGNCVKNLHHCFLELGGNDPMIMLEDCDMDLAVREAVNGRASNAGQTCCANKRFIVQNSIKEEFTQKLKAALEQVKVGDPTLDETTFGPVISERAAKDVESQIQHTIDQGAKCILGGKRNGAFIDATLLVDVTPDMDIAGPLEVFGPVWPVIGFDTVDEAIQIANQIPYGLQSGVMTKDMKKAFKVASAMQAGGCVINGSGNYRNANQPFGGYKMTGLGREGIAHTLEEMTQMKTIVLKGIFSE